MSSVLVWWRGARPRTLGAGLVPVVLGTAAAGHVIAWRFVAALLVGGGLQVGVNYANDYFDGVRGIDTPERMGPPRLTQSGQASPRAVLTAALIALGVAAVAGLALALATQPLLVLRWVRWRWRRRSCIRVDRGPTPDSGSAKRWSSCSSA